VKVEDLLKLCDEAIVDHQRVTPGPWKWWTSNSVRRLSSPVGDGDVLHGSTHPRDGVVDVVGNEIDKNFIATVRTREPVLAAALREQLELTTHLRLRLVEMCGIAESLAELHCRDVSSQLVRAKVAQTLKETFR
jgi:hypothetical protein